MGSDVLARSRNPDLRRSETTPAGTRSNGSPSPPRRLRFLLPTPVSREHALLVFILGFVVEGATEGYQFAARGSLSQGWVVYYGTLATTILGFYFMFLGAREWAAFRPRPRRRRTVPWGLVALVANAILSMTLWIGRHSRWIRRRYLLAWMIGVLAAAAVYVVATRALERPKKALRPRRRTPWLELAMVGGGTGTTLALGIMLGPPPPNMAPLWIVGPVGGLIVLAFGNFFLGLRRLVQPLGPRWSQLLGWAAFVWSLGVATVAGLVVGERAIVLLVEFGTNWVALIASVAPIVLAMSPLFITYGLLSGAFWLGRRELTRPADRVLPLKDETLRPS
jgi:hypothetical protein